jgi:hypothetical protein
MFKFPNRLLEQKPLTPHQNVVGVFVVACYVLEKSWVLQIFNRVACLFNRSQLITGQTHAAVRFGGASLVLQPHPWAYISPHFPPSRPFSDPVLRCCLARIQRF